MTVVDTIYTELQDAARILGDAGEVSLKIMLESHLRRTLLLSAASYFELRLTRDLQGFASETTSGNDLISSLIQSKVIARQYHSWFDWEKQNANKFFSMFGQRFKQHMSALIATDENLAKSVKAFLELGNDRNLLVHSDYASYPINKTPSEIHELYLSANTFVDRVGVELRACSASLHAPASIYTEAAQNTAT